MADRVTTVLHLIPSLHLGGAEKTLVEFLSDAEARRGACVVVFFGGGSFEHRLAELGVPVIDLKVNGLLSVFGSIYRLTRLLRRIRPEIVQTWLYYADFLGLLALLLSGRRGKTILSWGVRCSDHRLSEYDFPLRTVIRACASLSRGPDIVIYNSHAGQATHRCRGYRPRRELVIENGIDSARFCLSDENRMRVRAAFGWQPHEVVVVMIGRNDPQKGYSYFIDLVAKVSGIQAVAVGSGTGDLACGSNIARLGVRDDIPEILAGADILISCSTHGEGFPNVVAEGMAAGKPVICTDVGDARLIVGGRGIVVPPGNLNALVTALNKLIRNSELRSSMGCRGRAWIRSEFPLHKMVADFNELYRDLVKSL